MFSRDEVLGGLPARRASTLLFAIEGETARLVAASRITRAGFASERTSAEREADFLTAISTGGSLPHRPTITDLERFAESWSALVPPGPDVRAAIARLLADKHHFRASDVPGIRSALGLDTEPVASAYQRLHGVPLESVYTSSLPVRERLRWRTAALAARFDRLPPFWIAYFLALTEVLGEGMLSLPVALAGLGPLPGVALLLLFGLVNLITMGAMAEAVVRNGSMRYGLVYISRFVTELLGRVPAGVLGVVFAIDGFLAFWFYFLGFGSVLQGATGIPMGAWIALLFVVTLVILRKETLDDTIASAVVTGVVTMLLAVGITAAALLHVDPANLAGGAATTTGGAPDVAVLGLVFGVILMAFFGHTSAANSAKLLLAVEPSGRSLIGGNLAAMATVIVLYCVSTVAIIGAVGPAPLLDTTGTAFTPLADRLGPAVNVMAVLYTVLAIGIGSLFVTLGAYNQVIELLPGAEAGGPLARLGASRRGRLIAGFAPALLVLILLEVVIWLGVDDFVGAIAFAGTLTVPIITGVFPLLLVLAARRTGEYVPGRVHEVFGHPVTVVGLIGLFIVAIAVHGVIWEDPLQRLVAVGVAVLAALVVVRVSRSGVFRPRAIVELRVDRRQRRTVVAVTASGRVMTPETRVEAGPGGAKAEATVPAGPWRALRIWAHEVSIDGASTPLPADVEIAEPGGSRRVDVGAASDGRAADAPVIVTLSGEPARVSIRPTGPA